MKKADIQVGGRYKAKVNNRVVVVRVDAIREVNGYLATSVRTVYDVTNLSTGRTTTFKSAMKFKCEATGLPSHSAILAAQQAKQDAATERAIGKTSAELVQPEAISELIETDALAETLVEDEQCADPTESAKTDTETPEMTPTSKPFEPTSAIVTASNGSLAGRIAVSRQQREVGTPVAGMIPNDEQEAIIATAADPKLRVMVVAAGAGTGKTATLKMLEQVLPGRGQYTAFNASLVAESKAKFSKAACNTTHSLAFRAVGVKYKHRLGGERMRSHQIAKILGIESFNVTLRGMGEPDAEGKPTDKIKVLQADFLAGQVTVAIRQFCMSADREIGTKHFGHIPGIDLQDSYAQENNFRVREYLLPTAHKAWADLTSVNGTLPFAHDIYVKLWQLGKGTDRPVIAADYILLDEAQDTAPVFLDILQQQTHATLVLVGDDNQQIYEWRGAVNAMSAFPGAPRRLLSQSYRFGQAVADVANAVLRTLDEPSDLVMRGMPTTPSRVDVVSKPRCYLYRTNAGAVARIMTEVADKRKPHLIGGGDDVVRWCDAALDLQAKRGTRHPELCCFDSWKEVVEYSKTAEGADMQLMVKLIDKFSALAIRNALKDMPKEEDADLVVSTAHKSKGREWDTVRLGPDFPTANKMSDSDRRLLYVAATRAKLVLDISECPPFCGGIDRDNDDEWIPGLEVTYTAPMPTKEQLDEYLARQSSPTIATVAAITPAAQSDAPAQNPAPAANVATANGTFNWTNFGGRWCLRGPANAPLNQRVTAVRKNGSRSQEVIRTVVKEYHDAWIYGM